MSFIKDLVGWLITPKIVKISIILNLLIFLPGLLLAVWIAILFGPQGYSLFDNYISDLGSFNFTPIPYLFDFILIIGSLLIIPAFLYNYKHLTKDSKMILFKSKEISWHRTFHLIIFINSLLGLIFLFIASIGMFGIGIFSEDRTTQFNLHFYFSVLVFIGLIFGAMFVGIAIVLNKVICPRYLGLYMIFGPFFAGYFFLNPPLSLTEPFLEWGMMFSFQIWLIPAAFFTLKQIMKNS